MTLEELMSDEGLAQLVAKIREIAAANPDYVYNIGDGACEYKPSEANPNGCIVGYAARELGCPLDHFDGDINSGFYAIYGKVTQSKGSTAAAWIGEVQEAQDGISSEDPLPWGKAVEHADKTMGDSTP